MRPSKRLYRAAERVELEPADLDDCEEQEPRWRRSATPLIDGCTGAAAAVIGTFSLAHHFALHPALAWVCVASWCVAARTGVVAGPKCRARVLAAPCGAEVMWLPAALSLLLFLSNAYLSRHALPVKPAVREPGFDQKSEIGTIFGVVQTFKLHHLANWMHHQLQENEAKRSSLLPFEAS